MIFRFSVDLAGVCAPGDAPFSRSYKPQIKMYLLCVQVDWFRELPFFQNEIFVGNKM